jgi:hypothetical protein
MIGGKEAWSKLGKSDDPEASPPEGLIDQVMPSDPVLILSVTDYIDWADRLPCRRGRLTGHQRCTIPRGARECLYTELVNG